MSEKLFAIYLGGRADRCNIELHDVVFVVGSSIEETYPSLAKKWFGNMDQFHIDSYICLEYVDGYAVHLTKDISKVSSSQKLYFVNLGAYRVFEFTEHHQNAVYVAGSAQEAVKRAKAELCKGLHTIHKDDVVLLDQINGESFDVDDLMEIHEVDNYYILLTPTLEPSSVPVSAYIKLDMFQEDNKIRDRTFSNQDNLLKCIEKQEFDARKFGFYWENYYQLIEQIQSECVEVQDAMNKGSKALLEEEIGDLIQASVSLAIFFNLDPHETLLKSVKKFQKRYDQVVKMVREDGKENLLKQPFEVLMHYWKRAKT